MKRIIMLGMVLVILLLSLGGCYCAGPWGWGPDRDEGRGGGRGGDRGGRGGEHDRDGGHDKDQGHGERR